MGPWMTATTTKPKPNVPDTWAAAPPGTIPKTRTGIAGLDELTGGGLPAKRPTLVTGSAGSGKTLLGIEFLVHGALDFGEPGVLLAFEESAQDLADNVRSLGFDLPKLEADGLLVVDSLHIDPAQIVESGAYDLEGLFIRLASAVSAVGAKRVVLDTIEVLFSALGDQTTVRAELGRLFRWLKEHGLTTVVTGEPGPGTLTRHGIEEYVSDCVILLDHRVREELSTRRLRIVKYRGSLHGTNEYPFLITDRGLSVLPLSTLGLTYDAPDARIPTGIARLDRMLDGGYYQGSSVLISGGAGTGKTTLAAKALEATCARGERALFVSFEESPAQLIRDLAEVGIDLQRWLDAGLLRVWSGRPSAYGLEAHLVTLARLVEDFGPQVVALDAMTALAHEGAGEQVASAVTREVDLLKGHGITTILTSLTHEGPGGAGESTSLLVTSLMDTWVLLRNVESDGERNRLLFVRKSRGSAHSNQVREFVITGTGPDLVDVYVGAGRVLTGAARLAHEADERRAEAEREYELQRRQAAFAEHTAAVQAQISALRAGLEAESVELQRLADLARRRQDEASSEAAALAEHRWADPTDSAGDGEAR